ncbi:MAG TPA: DNA-3-methyladenine glycosylase I [Nitrososphaeraceae archaeon]|jgi:DNA-3-methyladenine glycosylase I|nr:DNA-3-methyladenine glycosylase I [Nitrososphaeraceae archaeon]
MGSSSSSRYKLFEFLVLEGAEAGLSCSTILKKRQDYRRAFDNLDVKRVAEYEIHTVDNLLNSSNTNIVRN